MGYIYIGSQISIEIKQKHFWKQHGNFKCNVTSIKVNFTFFICNFNDDGAGLVFTHQTIKKIEYFYYRFMHVQ